VRVVVALGGNALLRRGEPMTAENQRENVRVACAALAPVAREHELVISHGNGPQVGLLALQGAAYTDVETYPLDVLDADVAHARHLSGKPAPDTFLAGADLLGVPACAAAVFEDALAGVEAGRAGGFAIVVGVDRVGHGAAVAQHGADLVVTDLAELVGRQPHVGSTRAVPT